MTFDVLVVEDEPAARRYASSVIDQHCSGFRVVSAVEHGEAALTILSEASVDLVVTDARMPVLDGIGLLREMRRRDMDEPVLVLSGYDDYEYVRGALTGGAVDYVLKPAGAQRMRAALEGITPYVVDRIYRRRARILARSVVRADEESREPRDAMELWHVAVIRHGGLPRRFAQPLALGADTYHAVHSLLIVPGRDEREILCAAIAGGGDGIDTPRFRSAVDEVASAPESAVPFRRLSSHGTRTIGFVQRPSSMADLRDRFLRLTASIDRTIRPGRTVEVGETANNRARGSERGGLTTRETERIRVVAGGGNVALLATVVDGLQRRWTEEDTSLLQIRRTVEDVLRLLEHSAAVAIADRLCSDPENCEQIASWLREELNLNGSAPQEPGLFQAIRSYVDEHYCRHLSLTEVAESFRVSPSYVGKLFRKHRQTSLGEYVTNRRIELAKDLLVHDPQAAVKEIAATCGFDDQFYFSRVFKAHTGLSPSDFRENGE